MTTLVFTERSSRGPNWCKVSQRLDTNSRLEPQPLLHKHTNSPDGTTVSEIEARNEWAQIAPYSPLMSQHLAAAWGGHCLPSVGWPSAGSASSEARLVPGWGSAMTLFTFWKTQKKKTRLLFSLSKKPAQHMCTFNTSSSPSILNMSSGRSHDLVDFFDQTVTDSNHTSANFWLFRVTFKHF